MLNNPNILNIPANYHFFGSLFSWLENNFSGQISEVKIFLPNRRSCREFRELFLAKNANIILPQIKAISDISYEDFFDFLPNVEAKEIIDELLQIKSLSNLDYLFFLTKEIQKLSIFGDNLEFDQAFKIATNLQSLFDDIERDEIDLNILDEIDDSNLSKHRQLTLEFLKDFHVQVKNSLIKKNIFFNSSSQNFIIQKLVYLLDKYGSKAPIIIAGSTGSVSFSKKLIKAISKKNYVILHGATAENYEIENHPQFFLNRLTEFLGINKNAIQKIANDEFILSDESRQNLISLMILPAEKTTKWQEISQHLDIKKTALDLEKNFQLIEAKNEIEEAKIISLALFDALNNQKTAAVITNNDKLAKLIKLELEQNSLPFNDTRNLSIFNSNLVNFLLLILELIESDFNSHNLLALLKNPLCFYSKNSDLLADFEIKILRQDRVDSGISGILEKLKNEEILNNFFSEFCKNILPLKQNSQLALVAENLIKTAENLSQKTWNQLLEAETAQVEIFEFFEKLKSQSETTLKPKNILATFKTLLAQISYFEKSDSKAPIQILSSIEARLLNFDLVIIASLNEGDFPEIAAENWLGKKIKKDLGIDKTLKKIGQNAYDFCNYLSNQSIILTRCKSRNGAVLIESPFLLKFKTICQKIGIKLDLGEKYFAQLKNLNSPQIRQINDPNPKPKIEFRPKRISVTDISKLMSDPYDIYAKKILQLEELEKIDFEPSYAEFGSFIHKALEEFVKNPQEPDFIKKAQKIFEEYFLSNEAKLIWWSKFEKIFADFIIENEKFLNSENHVEIPAELKVSGITIRGKIDRVIIGEEGFAEIFDYKTGQIPAKKEVFSGANPQLTIAALMLLEGVIEGEIKKLDLDKIASLNYWKLSASSLSEIKNICENNEEIQILASAAKAGLERLFAYFSDEENGYFATGKNLRSEYRNLARIE
ncbi:MAG: PD-(D/E)XK nuclease family protein [Pseudomonadota bacterium]